MPQLKNGIEGRRLGDSFEQLECRLLESLELGGFKVDSNLAKRIVALKTLRNECVHVRPSRAEERGYRAAAGFSESVLVLRRDDAILALRTLAEIIDVFGRTWFPEYLLTENSGKKPNMRLRIDLMSDLPIYYRKMIDRLEAGRNVGRDA
jgi:hypothetical protein